MNDEEFKTLQQGEKLIGKPSKPRPNIAPVPGSYYSHVLRDACVNLTRDSDIEILVCRRLVRRYE
jgi:hypothetical protein